MASRVYYLYDQRIVFNPKNGEYSLAKGNPLICIVSERDCETKTIKYGYSVVHPEDMKFITKVKGRAEAKERFDNSPLSVETDAITGHDINRSIIKHFSEVVGKTNSNVRKLTKKWLKSSMAKARMVAEGV